MTLKVKIASSGNVYIRMMAFEKIGDVEPGHLHSYDHITLLACGKIKLTVDGKSTEFSAPHMIYIDKDKKHELVALEDNTLTYCIHANRDIEGNILSPDMIPQ